ncbi:hypothetical protein Tco_1080625 [Tanacetum coccineum]|uniref:Reverse transcriptase domain-containing protein n=1 Tax=Tanacetum coccineum TaxID=301880 RepID=A0ABQ5HVA6_9ASTR
MNTPEKLTCRRTCQVRSHHQNSEEAGMSKDISGPGIPIYPKKKTEESMVDSQPMEEEIRGIDARGVGTETHRGPTEPVLEAQKAPSPSSAFIKENIDVLRTMIKEHDQQAKTKATPRRLAYANSYKEAPARIASKNKEPAHLRRSRRLEDRSITKKKARREKSKSRGKRSGYQETSSDSEHEEGSEDTYEDLNSPYKRPKPTPFTQRITRFRYHQRSKLPRNIRVYEGNKDPENHLERGFTNFHGLVQIRKFAHKGSSSGLKYLDLYAWSCSSKTCKKAQCQIPKTMDEMFEKVRAFIRGEVVAGSAEMVRLSQGDKGNTHPVWSGETFHSTYQDSKGNLSYGKHKPALPEEESNNKETMIINPERPEQFITVGVILPANSKRRLRDIYPLAEPIVHKRRPMKPDGQQALKEKVFHWLKEGIIRKVRHPEWVANAIPIRQASGAWKVQVDYSSLNKVCAKDMYPFPEEGKGLASLMEYPYKCFLRLPRENSQIRMAEADEEKTGFHTEEGVYYFTHMPKGLKNLAVTQRMMERVLADQRGRNVEVYLEEIVIKRKYKYSLIQDVEETLSKLRRVSIKIDPNASTFGIDEGKFLGHMVTKEGVRADPEKVQVRMKLEAKEGSGWTCEAEEAFRKIKRKLSKPQALTLPKDGKVLMLFLRPKDETIISLLLVEREGI